MSVYRKLALATCAFGVMIYARTSYAQLDVYPEHILRAVPAPQNLRLISGGLEQLLADLYWLLFIQYLGDSKQRKLDHYSDATKFIDLITTLDPLFLPAYHFAAFVIGGEQGRPDLATKFLDRGIANNKDDWYLPFIAGVNQYLYAHNETHAAAYYELSSKRLGAPPWVARQAVMLRARIPSKLKEINTWNEVYHSATDPIIRQRAFERLGYLWQEVDRFAASDLLRKEAREQLRSLGLKESD